MSFHSLKSSSEIIKVSFPSARVTQERTSVNLAKRRVKKNMIPGYEYIKRKIGKEGKEQFKLNISPGVRANRHELTTNKLRLKTGRLPINPIIWFSGCPTWK